MKYEVSEVVKNYLVTHTNYLVTHTENEGYVVLAKVTDDLIYVCIDDVEFFDNVDQADAAQRDVDKFVRFWKTKGKKLL